MGVKYIIEEVEDCSSNLGCLGIVGAVVLLLFFGVVLTCSDGDLKETTTDSIKTETHDSQERQSSKVESAEDVVAQTDSTNLEETCIEDCDSEDCVELTEVTEDVAMPSENTNSDMANNF